VAQTHIISDIITENYSELRSFRDEFDKNFLKTVYNKEEFDLTLKFIYLICA